MSGDRKHQNDVEGGIPCFVSVSSRSDRVHGVAEKAVIRVSFDKAAVFFCRRRFLESWMRHVRLGGSSVSSTSAPMLAVARDARCA